VTPLTAAALRTAGATDGRREKHPRREIVNAILYVVRFGCPRRHLPADLPPWRTTYWYLVRWEDTGVTVDGG
jgi:transposase